MELRPLGDTGLSVSSLGLGLAALGRPGYITLGHADDLDHSYDVAAMQAHAHAVLDAAWDGGVRYVDAARSYGRAEEFLASWLQARGLTSEEITVGSKWGYTYTAGWRTQAEQHEVKEHTLATLERQLGESLALLGPWLRLYQVHSATTTSGVLDDAAIHERLARLRAETGIAIGLTLSGPDSAGTLRRALEIEHDGRRLFDAVQATWNLLEPSLGPLLAETRMAGVGIIIKEALANGRLTARNDDPAFAPQRRLLEQEAARIGCTLDQLALAAALAQPWADCVLSGAATVEHLRSNLGARAVALDAGALERLATLAEPPEIYWATRSRLPWN